MHPDETEFLEMADLPADHGAVGVQSGGQGADRHLLLLVHMAQQDDRVGLEVGMDVAGSVAQPGMSPPDDGGYALLQQRNNR